MIRIKKSMNKLLSEFTGKTIKQISADVERDYFMSADEAKDYGLVDEVISK